MKKLKLKIITPEKIAYEREVREVILPTAGSGQVGILADHVPYLAPLKADELLIKVNDDDKLDQFESLAIDFGIAEFADNVLTVLVADALRANEIDLKRAEAARARAEELMKEKFEDVQEYTRMVAILERELARIKVAEKYHHRRG